MDARWLRHSEQWHDQSLMDLLGLLLGQGLCSLVEHGVLHTGSHSTHLRHSCRYYGGYQSCTAIRKCAQFYFFRVLSLTVPAIVLDPPPLRLRRPLLHPHQFAVVGGRINYSALGECCVEQRRPGKDGLMLWGWLRQTCAPRCSSQLRSSLGSLRRAQFATMATETTATAAGAAPAVKLHGRAFYESIGSPKFVVAPMVDQSEFVRFPPMRHELNDADRLNRHGDYYPDRFSRTKRSRRCLPTPPCSTPVSLRRRRNTERRISRPFVLAPPNHGWTATRPSTDHCLFSSVRTIPICSWPLPRRLPLTATLSI